MYIPKNIPLTWALYVVGTSNLGTWSGHWITIYYLYASNYDIIDACRSLLYYYYLSVSIINMYIIAIVIIIIMIIVIIIKKESF